jgi:hypothetical protein
MGSGLGTLKEHATLWFRNTQTAAATQLSIERDFSVDQ